MYLYKRKCLWFKPACGVFSATAPHISVSSHPSDLCGCHQRRAGIGSAMPAVHIHPELFLLVHKDGLVTDRLLQANIWEHDGKSGNSPAPCVCVCVIVCLHRVKLICQKGQTSCCMWPRFVVLCQCIIL